MPKTIMISLDKLVNKYDVRVALDEDRVIQFAGMYDDVTRNDNAPKLPPIEVIKLPDTDKYAFVDGRTRAAARDLLGLQDIEAVVLSISSADVVGLFARALHANWAAPSHRPGSILSTR